MANGGGIPQEQSWGDLFAGKTYGALSDAGAALHHDGARAGQHSVIRLSVLGEQFTAGWANLLISNDAREAAADRETLTGHAGYQHAAMAAVVAALTKLVKE